MKTSLTSSQSFQKFRPQSSLTSSNYNKSFISDSLKNLKPIKLAFNDYKNKDPFAQMQQSKQNLRQIITNFVLNRMISKNKSPSLSTKACAFGKNHKIKYIQIKTKIQINQIQRQISFDFRTILQCYLQIQQKNIYRHLNIQPLIVDILNFLDQLDQLVKQMTFEMKQDQLNIQKDKQRILTGLIDIYHRKKQTAFRLRQLNDEKKKTIARFTRVSYLDIQNQAKKKQCQYLIQKTAMVNERTRKVNRSNIKELQNKKLSININSKLKDLVNTTTNIFAQSQKIQQIRQQKLKQFYNINSQSFNNKYQKAKQQSSLFFGNRYDNGGGCHSFQNIKFLDDWVAQINLSQALYFEKYCNRKINKKKTLIATTNNLKNQSFENEQIKEQSGCQSQSKQRSSQSNSQNSFNSSLEKQQKLNDKFGKSIESFGYLQKVTFKSLGMNSQLNFIKSRVSIQKKENN